MNYLTTETKFKNLPAQLFWEDEMLQLKIWDKIESDDIVEELKTQLKINWSLHFEDIKIKENLRNYIKSGKDLECYST